MKADWGAILFVWLALAAIGAVIDFFKKKAASDNVPKKSREDGTHIPTRSESAESGLKELAETISAGLTVGVYCAQGDGHVDSRELKLIHELRDGLLGAAAVEARGMLGTLMEKELQISLRGVSEERLHHACRLHSNLPEHFKGMTMQLAFKVVAADGRVDDREMECLRRVSALLGISDETFKKLESQHLEPIRIKDLANDQTSGDGRWKAFGIDPSWPKDRKLTVLNQEFQKYNARMSNISDQARRMECKRMLEIIAELREELTTGRKPPPKTATTPPPLPKPSTPRPRGPTPTRDEELIGIDPSLSPREKLSSLEREEARWKARLGLQITPAAKAKCESALQTIRRLRNVYQAQL